MKMIFNIKKINKCTRCLSEKDLETFSTSDNEYFFSVCGEHKYEYLMGLFNQHFDLKYWIEEKE